MVHYVGAISTALDNCKYFRNNNLQASAHYFVDDNSIWQSVSDSRSAWHCGGGLQDRGKAYVLGNYGAQYHGKCMNMNSIGIELCCYKDKNGAIVPTPGAIRNAGLLIQAKMKQYNIPSSRVIRHFDVTGKICPNGYINATAWANLKKTLLGSSSSIIFTPSNPITKGTASKPGKLDKDGIFGGASTRAMQRWLGTPIDGYISSQYVNNKKYLYAWTTLAYTSSPRGSTAIRSLQRVIGASADGILGRQSIIQLQKYLNKRIKAGLSADGYFGPASAKAFQRFLNTRV